MCKQAESRTQFLEPSDVLTISLDARFFLQQAFCEDCRRFFKMLAEQSFSNQIVLHEDLFGYLSTNPKTIVTLKNGGVDQKGADQDSQSIECRKCKRSFPSNKHLKEQIFVSHPKKINCDHCERTFSSNYELEKHADEHGLNKNFKCDICDKFFYLKGSFQ